MPGWHSVLLGVESSKHGVMSNSEYKGRNHEYKTFLWHGRNDFGLKTLATTSISESKPPEMLSSLIEDDATDLFENGTDADEESTILLESELIDNDY